MKKTLKKSEYPELPDATKLVKVKPPTMGQLIEKIFAGLSNAATVITGLDRQVERMVDRMSDRIETERCELKHENNALEQQVRQLRHNLEKVIRSNHYLRGRVDILEQIANIKPIPNEPEPSRDDVPFDPSFFNR